MKYLKALGALVSGVLGWATFVVNSPSAPITAPEWLLLAGVGVTVLTVFGVPNIGSATTIQLPATGLEVPFEHSALTPAPAPGIPVLPGVNPALVGVGPPGSIGTQSTDPTDVIGDDGTPT